MNFDEALAVVHGAFYDVFNREPFASCEKIIYGAERVKEEVKKKIGVEPICTNSSSINDVALSIMDVQA